MVDTLPRSGAICDPQMGAVQAIFNSALPPCRPYRRDTGKCLAMSNRRYAQRLLHSTLIAVALAACQPTIDQRGNLPDDKKISAIEPGVTTKQAVSQLLGTPSSVSTF